MSGVYRSGDFRAAPSPDLWFEPTTYALASVLGVTAFTQYWPKLFMRPSVYEATLLKKVTPRALIPGLVIPMAGFGLALYQLKENELIRGHILGFLSSCYMGYWGLLGYTHTPVTIPVGLAYLGYAKIYHYKRLMLFTDETVWWKWSDFDEIKSYYANVSKK